MTLCRAKEAIEKREITIICSNLQSLGGEVYACSPIKLKL